MNNGIWKKICLSVAAAGLLWISSTPNLFAQDNFREFDRKMVATPAELFEALSTLHPSKFPEQLEQKRSKEIEQAGRELLSKMSPEQQEKLWEFVEKNIRKNGVDAASSKKLMQEFGLPPEIQSELAKQFRKFGNQRGDADGPRDGEQEDEISKLLKKAREQFSTADLQKQPNEKGAVPSSRTMPVSPTGENGIAPRGESSTLPVEPKEKDRSIDKRDLPKSANAATPNPQNKRTADGPQSPLGQPEPKSTNKPGRDQRGQPFGLPPREISRANRDASNVERDPRSGMPMKLPGTEKDGTGASPDGDIEQLLKKLGGLTEPNKSSQGPGGKAREKGANSAGDIDWETLVKNLAEREIGDTPSNDAALPESSKSGVDKAKDLFSSVFNPNKKPGGSGSGGSESGQGGSRSNESVGTQFDRLLVKAVDRTLTSKNDEGISQKVGGMLGNLIERFQDQAKKKGDETRNAKRDPSSRNFGDRQARRRERRNQSPPEGNSSNNRSDNNWNPQPEVASSPNLPTPEPPSSNPGNLLEQLPNLSNVNPTHVFTFFAITGIVLFVGYLLMQSFVGDDEVASRKRDVVRQVRKTTIRSPKDLVETVDMFLLAKFGIKSSWWNANLAQSVLNSGSPGLKERIDDLFRDYVRARYMQQDIEIPEVDQQRFKKTLEELSKLDIKPAARLSFATSKPALDAAASLEG